MNEQTTLLMPRDATFTESAGLPTGPVPLGPYHDQQFYERECDAVFGRAWLLMGREEELPGAGDFVVKQVEAKRASILLVRGKAGAIQAFHNSCSHRGSKVVTTASGRAARFVCPYHNWSYATDGALLGVPDRQSFFDVDKKTCGLKRIATSVWEGWVFINLEPDPEVSLEAFLGDFGHFLAGIPYVSAQHPIVVTANLDANWKVVSDAFIETYHIPAIHPETIGATFASGANPHARLLDAQVYGPHSRISEYGNPDYRPGEDKLVERLGNRQGDKASVIAAAASAEMVDFLQHPAINPTRSSNWAMDNNLIFPNTQLCTGPGGFWFHQFWPTSRNTTRYEVRFYSPPAIDAWARFQQELYVARVTEVVLEDLINVARTQEGIETGGNDFMQLQDNEVAIRNSVYQVEKFVRSSSLREALS